MSRLSPSCALDMPPSTADRFGNWQRWLRHGSAALTVGCQYASITSQGFDKCGATSNPACSEVGSRPGRAFVGVGCTKAPSFNDLRSFQGARFPSSPSSKSFFSLAPAAVCELVLQFAPFFPSGVRRSWFWHWLLGCGLARRDGGCQSDGRCGGSG